MRKLDCNNVPEILKIRTMPKVDFHCNMNLYHLANWAARGPFRIRHGSGIRNMFSLMENLCNHKVFSEDPNLFHHNEEDGSLDRSFRRRKFHHNR
jgi:hypothetical protein